MTSIKQSTYRTFRLLFKNSWFHFLLIFILEKKMVKNAILCGWQWHDRSNNGSSASRAMANRMESGAVSLTSGCLIGVATNGVTGTPYRGVSRIPESYTTRIRHRSYITTMNLVIICSTQLVTHRYLGFALLPLRSFYVFRCLCRCSNV